MEPDAYKIDVLHFLNPHVLWVEGLQTSPQNKKFAFELIGVYGILPLKNEFHVGEESFKSCVSREWDPRAKKILQQIFADAVEMEFKQIFTDRNSIFENQVHKYGDIIIKWTDGKIKSLTRILQKSDFAIYDENNFKSALQLGTLHIKLNELERHNVLKILKKSWHMKHKLPLSSGSVSDTSLKTDNCKQNHDKYELTKKNLELHNMQTEKLDDPKRLLSYTNEFNELPMSMNLSKSNQAAETCEGDENRTNSLKIHRSLKKEIDPTCKRLLNTKKKLFKMIDTCAVNGTEKKSQVTLAESDYVSEHTQLKSELLGNLPKNIPYEENKIVQKNMKVTDDKGTATLSKSYSKLRKKKIPEFDEKTMKYIARGPPDCLQNLNIQIEPKYSEISTSNVSVATIEGDIKCESKKPQENKIGSNLKPIDCDDSEHNSRLDRVKLHYILKEGLKKSDFVEKLAHRLTTDAKIDGNKVTDNINVSHSPNKESMNCIAESNDLNISLNSSSSQLITRKMKFLGLETSLKGNVLNDSSLNNVSYSSTDYKDLQIDKSNSRDWEESKDSSIIEEILQSKEYLSLLQTVNKYLKKGKKLSVKDILIANCVKQNNVNPLKNIDPNVYKFVDKLISPNLMVHTKNNNRIIPNLEMREMNFVPSIHAVLRNTGIKHPMMLQTVSWSTILRGFSLFMVSPSRSGKTLGYLPAISNLVIHHKQEIDGFGPICIVVCATAKAVADAANLCKRFVGNSRTVLSYYSGIDEEQFLAQLLNGCDILVSTLPALVRLMNVGDISLNLQRLSTLVMDDCETLSQSHQKEIKFLISEIKKLLQKRVSSVEKVQIIVASSIWCDFMGPFAKWTPDTVVCIGSHLECVLYSKVHTSIDFLQKDKKLGIVAEFMKNVDITKKTVIVCQTDEEVTLVENWLKKDKIVVFKADSTMTVETLYNLSEDWREYSDPVLGPVLVCCDENLIHLNITDAHNLLHYSLPKLYSTFAKRFSVLADIYPSIFTNNDTNSNMIKILVDKENIKQLPKILHFVKRSSKEVPPCLDQIASDSMIEKDFLKAERFIPLCDYLLSLARCPNFWNCKARHTMFKEYDESPSWVPKHGCVTFQVITVNNAVTYSSRLLSHVLNGETFKYSHNYSTIAMKMAMYYSNEDNRRPHGIPKIGDICAVAVKINLYQRCQIVKILTFNDKGNPELLLIKLIDDEKWEKAKVVHLYYLPDELKNVPSYVVQVRLGNIQPKDKDVTYSYIADDYMKKILNSDESLYMKAEVVLAVGTTLIVDKLEICQDLVFANQPVVRYNVRKELLKVHALSNDEHMSELQKIVAKAGLLVHNKDAIVQDVKPSRIIKELPKPLWAHLSKDDFSLVYFASANNPSQFFIRLVKFQNCLNSLTKDIQKYIANTMHEKVTTYRIGELVLAKFPDDGLYYRARIEESLNKIKYRCFFVDHGDWREISPTCIFPITEQFITRMPFQAIECRLIGIEPIGEEWTEFSTNWFCDQCFMDKSDMLKKFYVKYFMKEVPELTGGYKYDIIMIDTTGPKDIIINQSILDANLAQPVDNEIDYIEKLNFQRPVEESSNSDESDWGEDDILYKDAHYQRKVDDFENTTKLPLEDIFPKKPIRSVPLVASDDESDDFDVDMTQEDIRMLFNQTSKVTNTQQAIPKIDSLETETISESFKLGTQLENRISNLKSRNHEMIVNEKEMIDTSKFHIDDEQLLPSISELSRGNEMSEVKDIVEGNKNNTSSTSSDLEAVSLSIKSVLDSDDFSTSGGVSVHIEGNAKAKKLKPKICWNQTKAMISLKIQIIGVDDYEINIKERYIKFSTTVNDIQYAFNIELYGTIKPNISKHDAKGLYVLVKLYKRISKIWLTLTKDDQMKQWIVYDPDSIDTSSDDDDDCSTSRQEQFKKYVGSKHYSESDTDSDDDSFDDTPKKYNINAD